MASSSSSWEYDVLLSFRGKDTRKNFVSHLYTALYRKGIIPFKDDKLGRGKTISEELAKAIRSSRILIVIFSRNYAFSTWCLDELLEIYECLKSGEGQTVMPVFYDVSPHEVRKQTGRFGTAFAEHEKCSSNFYKVKSWKAAIAELASLSGWDLQHRNESELIEDMVKEILRILRKSSLSTKVPNAKPYVGMNSRLMEMNMYLNVNQSNKVLFIGISGMGGIGKTTIARVVYEELSCQFDGSCFLANVREVKEKHGLMTLQQQLLSEILMDRNIIVWDIHSGKNEIINRIYKKRVLVILDDVDELEQLKSLAGRHDWFGSGSRIIITTRDEHLLKCHEVDKIYKVQGLSEDEAISLFYLRAFKSNCPPSCEFVGLSNEFVNYCNGLPLALDVLGSFLFDKSVDEWRSAQDRLKEIPNQEILEKLSISFDGLGVMEKKIFLDIACFFNGENKDYVIKVLECCGFYPHIGIRDLLDKSLINISKQRIWMHDLLQELGREIVRQESSKDPGKRSRLWLYKDVHLVLSNDMGTEQIEGIVLDSCEPANEELNAKAFAKMKWLRLLKLRNLKFSKGLEYLSNNLRYLDWDRYPFKSFPSTFQPNELVELHMRCSKIEHMWKRIKPVKMLKVIDLSYSLKLTKTMEFKDVPNLEELNLEGCTRLFEVHQSIEILANCLFSLNFKDCKSLVSLPSSICDLKSLKYLNLNGCSKLGKLPERLGDMTSLDKLDLGGIVTSFQLLSCKAWDFPIPWKKFSSQNLLRKNPNPMAETLPSLLALKSLTLLNLSYCNLIEGALPNDLSCFPSLRTLDLSGNNFVNIPSNTNQLLKLQEFRFADCKKLRSFPNLPSSILYVSIDGCSVLLETLHSERNYSNFNIYGIRVNGCKKLQSLPDLSSSVLNIIVEGLTIEEATPNPFGEKFSRPDTTLYFINILICIEVQGENMPTISRMSGYLHYLLRHRKSFQPLGLSQPSSKLSLCFAGSEVPGWFNYQSPGPSLEMALPSYWWTNMWWGFAFCIAFEFKEESILDTYNISCNLHACVGLDQDLFIGHSSIQFCKGFNVETEQLWVYYLPRSSLIHLDKWEASNCLKLRFFSTHLSLKHCGIRRIYFHDVEELVMCNKPFVQELLPQNGNDEKTC